MGSIVILSPPLKSCEFNATFAIRRYPKFTWVAPDVCLGTGDPQRGGIVVKGQLSRGVKVAMKALWMITQHDLGVYARGAVRNNIGDRL
jgi:hypothetical protein